MTQEQENENLGERRLIAAIIERAYFDAIGETTGVSKEERERIIKEARNWLNSESNKPYSFFWYCNLIGIEPSKIVKKINFKGNLNAQT